MARRELLLFTNDHFGRPFQIAAREECRALDARLTIVLPDPIRGMTPLKRRRTRTTRPIRQWIERRARGARVWLIEDINAPGFRRRLPRPVHAAITGYPHIFKQPTIDQLETFVNVHPSLLPYYRGPAPIYWCLKHGEAHSGFTIHEVTEEVDGGPILRQAVVSIGGPQDAMEAIVGAAVPAFVEWLRHALAGADFPIQTVDAASVYRVLDGYRSLTDRYRTGRPAAGS